MKIIDKNKLRTNWDVDVQNHQQQKLCTAQKMKFSIMDFFSECDECTGFGHIYWRNT